MPKDTPSMAKNKMRRCLVAIYDPHPSKTEVNELWQYFESRCAYCGEPIERDSRTGHLDHLIPAAEGGRNSLYNHALSCARCNGDEKREESWQSFLAIKATDSEVYKQRQEKIEHWLSLAPAAVANPKFLAQAEAIIDEAIQSFESAVEKMRALRAKST
jgi:hypothetical protein